MLGSPLRPLSGAQVRSRTDQALGRSGSIGETFWCGVSGRRAEWGSQGGLGDTLEMEASAVVQVEQVRCKSVKPIGSYEIHDYPGG